MFKIIEYGILYFSTFNTILRWNSSSSSFRAPSAISGLEVVAAVFTKPIQRKILFAWKESNKIDQLQVFVVTFFNKTFSSSNRNHSINDTSFFCGKLTKMSWVFHLDIPTWVIFRLSAEFFLVEDKSIDFDFRFLRYLSRKVWRYFYLHVNFCWFFYSISKQFSSVSFLYCSLLWSVLFNDSWTASNSMFPSMVSFWDKKDLGSKNKYLQTIYKKLVRLKI